MAYCSAEDIETRLDISSGDIVTLTALTVAISDWIDVHCHVPPGGFAISADSTRYYSRDSIELGMLKLDYRIVSVTTLTNGNGTAITGYRLYPRNAENYFYISLLSTANGWLWTDEDSEIAVTGKFGYSTTVPKPVSEFAIAASAKLFKIYQAALQETTANFDTGQLIYRDAGISKLLWMLDPYVDRSKML